MLLPFLLSLPASLSGAELAAGADSILVMKLLLPQGGPGRLRLMGRKREWRRFSSACLGRPLLSSMQKSRPGLGQNVVGGFPMGAIGVRPTP